MIGSRTTGRSYLCDTLEPRGEHTPGRNRTVRQEIRRPVVLPAVKMSIV